MKLEDILPDLKTEYTKLFAEAGKNFNSWISTGEDCYKERELMHLGAAQAILKIIEIIEQKKGE